MIKSSNLFNNFFDFQTETHTLIYTLYKLYIYILRVYIIIFLRKLNLCDKLCDGNEQFRKDKIKQNITQTTTQSSFLLHKLKTLKLLLLLLLHHREIQTDL